MTRPAQSEAQSASAIRDAGTIGEQTFTPMLRSYGAWLDNAAKVQTEALRFIADRVRKDLEMPARLAECKGPVDVLEVQTKFASTMFSDYVSEAGKLLSMGLEGVRESAAEATRAKGE